MLIFSLLKQIVILFPKMTIFFWSNYQQSFYNLTRKQMIYEIICQSTPVSFLMMASWSYLVYSYIRHQRAVFQSGRTVCYGYSLCCLCQPRHCDEGEHHRNERIPNQNRFVLIIPFISYTTIYQK